MEICPVSPLFYTQSPKRHATTRPFECTLSTSASIAVAWRCRRPRSFFMSTDPGAKGHGTQQQQTTLRPRVCTSHPDSPCICVKDQQSLNLRSPSQGGWPTDTSSAVQAEAGPSSTHVNTKLCEPQPSVSVYLSCLVLFY